MAEPPAACHDLAGVWLGMNAPLAAGREFEMLDRIGDINPRPVDAGFLKRGVEHGPGRSNEGPPDQILLVAWLLSDEVPQIAVPLEQPLGLQGLRQARSAIAWSLTYG